MQNIRTNNPQQVNRLLNRTINQLLNGEIDENRARCIGYLGSVLLKAQELEDIAVRLEALEKNIEKAV